MLFDTFCAAAEKSGNKEMLAAARQAALFDFPYTPHEVLPKEHSLEQIEFLQENFFLPFRYTAIEDKATCCVLYDLHKDQVGGDDDRGFFDVLAMSSDISNFRPIEATFGNIVNPNDIGLGGVVMVVQGVFDFKLESSNHDKVSGRLIKVWEYDTATKQIADVTKEMMRVGAKYITEAELRNAKTAIEEVMHFNTPERFVVQVTPRGVRPANAVKIPRSHERSRYLLLKPTEIKAMFGDKEDGGEEKRGTPAPHQRRRHWRHLRSEKYTNMRGQSIIIPASWVGPSEASVKGRQYKVMLDL